ncbi:hypothetical protein Taro_044257, partial [Colocasia esculenta]|nr:hypothetical protein [Colocasia esculenta]
MAPNPAGISVTPSEIGGSSSSQLRVLTLYKGRGRFGTRIHQSSCARSLRHSELPNTRSLRHSSHPSSCVRSLRHSTQQSEFLREIASTLRAPTTRSLRPSYHPSYKARSTFYSRRGRSD